MSASKATKTARVQKRGRNVTPEGKAERMSSARRGINTSNAANAALIAEDKPLTQQQRVFTKLWAQGESISTAALLAGFSNESYAYRLVRQPNVLALYREEKAAYERDASMTRAQVIEGFKEGIEMGKLMADAGSVIRGWREIGLMCGYYEPVKIKHEISVEGKLLVERMENMSDEDLFKLIEARAASMQAQHPALLPQGNPDDDADADGGGA